MNQNPTVKPSPEGPLSGIRVLTFAHAWSGPFATELLGLLGAEVVQIEAPHRSDVWRRTGNSVPEGVKDENSPFKPLSPYGVAKVFGHNITIHYREAYKLFACLGILFNHESPHRGLEFVTRKITYTLARIKFKKQEKLRLGNIHAKRDWGFAGEYVETMWTMLQQKNPDDYVIATGESHSVEEFLDLASEYAGLGDWHKFVEIDDRMNRPTDIEELIGDSTKARKQLGWSPKVGFKELVKMMVEYDINNLKSSIDP